MQCCSSENLNSFVFGRVVSFKRNVIIPTPPHPTPALRSIKDVFMCKERHHLRSIKDVFMCKERHHPHPTPPQFSVASKMCSCARNDIISVASKMCSCARNVIIPTPPQTTPLWPPANGYNHGYDYMNMICIYIYYIFKWLYTILYIYLLIGFSWGLSTVRFLLGWRSPHTLVIWSGPETLPPNWRVKIPAFSTCITS